MHFQTKKCDVCDEKISTKEFKYPLIQRCGEFYNLCRTCFENIHSIEININEVYECNLCPKFCNSCSKKTSSKYCFKSRKNECSDCFIKLTNNVCKH